MATNGLNGLNGPDKKSKQHVNGLRRDQPLFGSRRSGRSLQQAPDFLTDSLNTSYIPSPSPPKSPTRREARARPRLAFGNGRSVAPSLKATPRSNDENKRPPGLSSSDRRNQQHLKSLPKPSRPNITSPSNQPAQSPARTQTPSPPRGRQNSVTSPAASESSPGRGYAEAYQRIVEEENLAQEESIEDMEEMSRYDFNEQDRSQDIDRMRLKRIQHSASPISLKASRRASPRGTVEDNIPASDGAEDKENLVRDSDSESGADYNATVTDTSIGSGSSQYAKDLQRLGAIKDGAKIFSKARVGEKVGLSVENLQRRNGSNESLGSAFSAGSLSQRGSDPSVNIPKAWGRKAKPGKDWLNRINSKSGRFTGDVPKRRSSGEPIITDNQEREWAEPIDSWIAAASEVALPSGEGSSQTVLSSQSSTPTTALPRSSSMDRRRQWEANEDEFTGRSLQVSDSPPMRIRNATLDRYRDREIENLEKRAVTTNRLGELREKGSDELLRRRPPSRSTEEKKKDDSNTNESSPRRQSSSGSSVRSRLQESAEKSTPDATLDDAGEPIPDTPVVIYRSKSNDQSAVDAKGGMKPEDMNGTSRTPQHERKDSHDLLKRLARATSDSPSPAKEQEEESRPGIETEDKVPTFKSPSNVKTPVVTGAWVDQTMGDTPQASRSKADLKTPLVTGAWIDTPLPTGRGPPMPTPSNLEDEKELQVGKIGATDLIRKLSPSALPEGSKSQDKAPLKYSGPPLPKSALDGIIKQAKSTNPQKPSQSFNSDSEEDPTLHLGDSTIQSLEDLLANDTEILALPAPTPLVQGTNSSSDPSPSQNDRSSTSTNPSRLTDLQSYTHLLSRLTNLAPSIRASKNQIASLQRAVSAPPSTNRRNRTRSQSLTNDQSNTEPCNEAGEFHDFIWPCARCGCPAQQPPPPLPPALLTIRNSLDTTTLTIPIPRLWTWPTSSWRPRLTWLGLLTLLAWILINAELWARDRFCHPLYASSMVGYGVDINAPRPPFVLIKVIYRYTAVGTVLTPIYHAARIITRLVAAFVGYIIGFIFGDETNTTTTTGGAAAAATTTRLPVSRDARIPKPVWGPDLSLMDDEYL